MFDDDIKISKALLPKASFKVGTPFKKFEGKQVQFLLKVEGSILVNGKLISTISKDTGKDHLRNHEDPGNDVSILRQGKREFNSPFKLAKVTTFQEV